MRFGFWSVKGKSKKKMEGREGKRENFCGMDNERPTEMGEGTGDIEIEVKDDDERGS